MRYLIIQVGSGVLLLAGVILHVVGHRLARLRPAHRRRRPAALGQPGRGADLPRLRHQVRLPAAAQLAAGRLPRGDRHRHGLSLSAFTTKLAVYALARGFPGTEILIWIGAIDDRVPDLLRGDRERPAPGAGLQPEQPARLHGRRHRHRHRAGAQRHRRPTPSPTSSTRRCCSCRWARCCYRTGTVKGSELGGLYKSMPCDHGLLHRRRRVDLGLPVLLSGFVTKSMILDGRGRAATDRRSASVLLFASAGVFHHSGIKIPYLRLLRPRLRASAARKRRGTCWSRWRRCAVLCIVIGVFPGPLYAILPFQPWTTSPTPPPTS